MLHVCLSGISSIVGGMDGTGYFTCAFDPSIVAVMDGTGCFTCAFLGSPPLWGEWMELDTSRVPSIPPLWR